MELFIINYNIADVVFSKFFFLLLLIGFYLLGAMLTKVTLKTKQRALAPVQETVQSYNPDPKKVGTFLKHEYNQN